MGKTLSKILKQKVKVYIADVLLELENLAKFSDSVIFGYPRVLVASSVTLGFLTYFISFRPLWKISLANMN